MTLPTVTYPGVKRICEMAVIEVVEFFVEEIFALDLHVELCVNLLGDVIDNNSNGMDLLDVDIPGQSRM